MSTLSVTVVPPAAMTRLQRFEHFLEECIVFVPEHLPAIVADIEDVIASIKTKGNLAGAETAAADASALIGSVSAPAGAIAQEAAASLNAAIDGEQAVAAAITANTPAAPAAVAPAAQPAASAPAPDASVATTT